MVAFEREAVSMFKGTVWASVAWAVCCLLAVPELLAQESDWATFFERSGGLATPRYDETVAYCQRLAEASPWVRYTTFGVSPQGRPLPLVIADRDGYFEPGSAPYMERTVVLVEACIHAGECCGKDAGLMLLRDMTVGGRYRSLLDHVTLLFIPIFNVDGHERFGPYNRINQNGPTEMGWRTTAQNLNLNRDFLKADAPEMRAWLELFQAWKPDFFIDVHSTDGADYQYPITYAMEIHGNMDAELTEWTRERFLPYLDKLMVHSNLPASPYVVFRDWHDPRSGMVSWVASPRLSEGYTALQNRPGLLIEAHMLKSYAVRVEAAYTMLRHAISFLGDEHPNLRQTVLRADARTAAELADHPFPLRFAAAPESVMMDFLGYKYKEVDSDISGGTYIRFSDAPQLFRIPYFNVQKPSLEVILPEAYIIPPEWTEVIERLRLHGVQLARLSEDRRVFVRSYRFREAVWQEQPYEGRHPVEFKTDLITEERDFPQGTVVVNLRQPAARVAVHILEPQAPDSYAQWGFFDAVFEQKEYAESYVIEEMAREMLAADPELEREFKRERKEDRTFAGDPRAIRQWFFERTPYFDSQVNVYPVGLIDDPAVVESLPLESCGP
jgi:hypothetical protein